ncbi:MAG TPA: dihydrolipoamide acetyltransferase family protein [Gaiellaceae bacterium]
MATEIKLPRLGQGMESGTIVKWLKAEGDPVEKGEPLYELDTDKVTQEVEADASGVLLKIAIAEGEVEVGKTIAVIGKEGEAVPEEAPAPAEKPKQAREPARATTPPREDEPDIASTAAEPSRDGGRIKASPLARRIARERGVELAQIQGTGPDGRIVAEDVERAAAAAPTAVAAPAPVAAEIERVPLTSLRKTIARRLTEAWQAPAFQISMSADMSRALAIRARLVELAAGGTKPTISDLLTKVCAAALMRHRAVNATFTGDAIDLHPSANVGIAVASERGLVVPVIHGCERLSIQEIAAARADVVERARGGKLQSADLEDGTFTISNLGMYGVEQFVAVLNPPQAAILAVGAVEDRAAPRDGAVVVRPMMSMTLTCDHRSLDGAVAADFLRTVKTFLEEPGLAL